MDLAKLFSFLSWYHNLRKAAMKRHSRPIRPLAKRPQITNGNECCRRVKFSFPGRIKIDGKGKLSVARVWRPAKPSYIYSFLFYTANIYIKIFIRCAYCAALCYRESSRFTRHYNNRKKNGIQWEARGGVEYLLSKKKWRLVDEIDLFFPLVRTEWNQMGSNLIDRW